MKYPDGSKYDGLINFKEINNHDFFNKEISILENAMEKGRIHMRTEMCIKGNGTMD
jgi:hypothetical protein